MVKGVPDEVRRAVTLLAGAVRAVADLYEAPRPHPQAEYHAAEYITEMETILVHQLLTAFDDDASREAVLSEAGLDYLCTRVKECDRQWREDDKQSRPLRSS